MNLKPLTSHLVLYGTTRSPEAAHIAQQHYKEADLSLKCTLSVSLREQVTEMLFGDL